MYALQDIQVSSHVINSGGGSDGGYTWVGQSNTIITIKPEIMWKKTLISIALRILKKHVVGRIKYLPLRSYIDKLVSHLDEIIAILVDKDPDNKAQFEAFWQEENSRIFRNTLEAAADIILAEVKDQEDAKMYAQLLLSLIDNEEDEEEEVNVKSLIHT